MAQPGTQSKKDDPSNMIGSHGDPSFDSNAGHINSKTEGLNSDPRPGIGDKNHEETDRTPYGRRHSLQYNDEERHFERNKSRWYTRGGSPSERGTFRSMILPHTYEAGDPYYIGDAYEESQVRRAFARRPNSNETVSLPYCNYIDILTDNGWPQLRYLADWMRVTTAPPKWKFVTKEDTRERASRVNMTLLEFRSDSNTRHDVTKIEHLTSLLSNLASDQDSSARMFIVEDLSRDVIEALGSHLDVDPMFFRGFISDYSWYNTRDPWTELPEMDIVARAQSFFHVRFAHARYFRDRKSFARARHEAGGFNVLRRIDHDGNWVSGGDIQGSGVGLVRSRMSFWMQPQKPGYTGPSNTILLLDPSINEGFPLWGGYNDPRPCPPMADAARQSSGRGSTFENIVHWLEQSTIEEIESIAHDPRALFQKPLCIVSSEWLTLVRYANTRLSQLEWEIEDPYLRHRHKDLSSTLDKIHSWRRRFPIYKSLVSEALNKVIRRQGFPGAIHNSLIVLEKDFEIILSELGDLHERAERIISVVTAVMSIDESKKALQQDRGIARLTYLAVTFVPLSFVSSFFSMTEDITKLRQTFWVYFSVAVPVTLMALIVVRFSDVVIEIGRWMIRRKRMAFETHGGSRR
ncbi:MAG: hypothetical protein Q9216_004836 [Gyalolechia sp. 2 TL-2023]